MLAIGKATVEDARKIDDGLERCAGVVLRKALKYVPVDTRDLYNSGRVEGNGKPGFGARWYVMFGGVWGFVRDGWVHYALYVHEDLSVSHAPPTCAKFLERAAREVRGTCTSILRRVFKNETVLTKDGEVVK